MPFHYVLIAGAALNGYGAVNLFISSLRGMHRISGPDDYWQLRLFVSGTALTFGLFYLYLFFKPEFVWPFLIFGAALKSWACLLSLALYKAEKLSRRAMVEFGLSNGLVAGLFWLYLWYSYPAA